ncbi:hypothetical protein LTR95_014005 [Oleoguttula sp. CCFEE 5521]
MVPATATAPEVTSAFPAVSGRVKRKRSSHSNATAQLKAPLRVIKTRSIAAREGYIKSCKPAQEVFGITELTKAILLKGLPIQKLYQLKRLRKVVFLEPHCDETHPNPTAFTSFSPLLLLDEFGLGKDQRLCHPRTPVNPGQMNAEVTLAYQPLPEYGSYSEGPSSYVGKWGTFGDCVENSLEGRGKGALKCATQSWKKTRISAWSVPVHACVYATVMRREFIVLPPDSTVYHLICRVSECLDGDVGSELTEGSFGVTSKRLPEWWVAKFN